MKIQALTALFLGLMLAHTACAETPSTVVPVQNPLVDATGDTTDPNINVAVQFKGFVMQLNDTGTALEPSDRPCSINMTVMEEGDEHHMVAELTRAVHGQKIPAFELSTYYLADGNYVELRPDSGTFTPALIGILLKNDDQVVDVNKLREYEQNGELLRSMQIFFDQSADMDLLGEEVEELTHDGAISNLSDESIAILSDIQNSTVKIEHIGHYDTLNCGAFSIAAATVLHAFDFEAGDDNHDHDHDHDHDH
jgi:hypothetical protein